MSACLSACGLPPAEPTRPKTLRFPAAEAFPQRPLNLMDAPRPAGPTGSVELSRFQVWAIAALAAAFLAGCIGEDPVVVEKVPKDPPPRTPKVEAPADRMLAAVVPHGDTAWFFKLTGPERAVAPTIDAFLGLVKSIRFEGDRARWKLPEGWKESAGNAMRLATLEVPGNPPLQVAVSSLPYETTNRDEYVLTNLNRWRGQMGLPPWEADEFQATGDESRELALADGTKATVVDFLGIFESGGMVPAAGNGAATAARASSKPEDTESPLRYDVPTGWEEVGADGISLATFTVHRDSSALTITVTPMPASNDLLMNVNRWRDQVGLPRLDNERLDEAIAPISLGQGAEGKYITLVGPDGTDPQTAILGVVAVRGDTAWFVKLKGDAKAALRERPNFEAFVRSLRLPNDGG